ncbi:MAG: hypothetical protein NVS1B14_09400 [Vulcanimicrobiaceae bacterium]
MPSQDCCPPSQVLREDFEAGATLFKALADPHRSAILAALAHAPGPICVCDFVEGLPLNQPTVSHHLKVLRDAELVTTERRGTWVYYSLAPQVDFAIRNAVDRLLPNRAAA